jgi:hypothetical protein
MTENTETMPPDRIYFDGSDVWPCYRHSNVYAYTRAVVTKDEARETNTFINDSSEHVAESVNNNEHYIIQILPRHYETISKLLEAASK